MRYIPLEIVADPSTYQAVLIALCTQLVRKWNYAADEYRADHPHKLPPSKGRHPCTRLLPIEVAEAKMATWIPWAIYTTRTNLERLLPYSTL
jgi:hypothetical protein